MRRARPGGRLPGSPSTTGSRSAPRTGLVTSPTSSRSLGLDPVEVADVVGRARQAGPRPRLARHGTRRWTRLADRLGATAVLLGHTRDDQAETVLLGLARGSGARSLAGMAVVSGRLRRPFLALGRADVRAAALAQGLTPWDDPHNDDPAFARVRVRHDLLPALEVGLGPGVGRALARTADLLRADADALDGWADQAATAAARPTEDGASLGLDVEVLAALPEAVRTRVLRRAAVEAGCPAGSLGETHVRALDALVIAWHGQGAVALPGGVSGRRDCGRLLLARDRASQPSAERDVTR